MKTCYEEVEVYIHVFLAGPRYQLEVSGQLHAPAALPSGKESPVPHCIGGWLGTPTTRFYL
jgi:hypothetical protein